MGEGQHRILVADDDSEIRKVLQLTLQRAGYQVSVAATGEETLERLRQERPELLLLDIMMPKVDGLEVMRQMRDDEGLRRVPVIAFTALSSQLIEKEMFDLGVRGFMRKPLHISDLVEMIAMELKRIAQEQAAG